MPTPTLETRPPDQYEILYNSAVQSFVRRDHVRAQAALARLVEMSAHLPRSGKAWWDLDPDARSEAGAENGTNVEGADEEGKGKGSGTGVGAGLISGEEWVIKTLRLVVSAAASLYTDPPRTTTFERTLQAALPPAPPSSLLSYVQGICESTYFPSSSSSPTPRLLPPQLVSTILLAALKLRPADPSLSFAHTFAEDWLTRIPDAFVAAISAPPNSTRGQRGVGSRKTGGSGSEVEEKRRVEVAREGYLKVVELFVGEVLGREGEWEMARGILDGDSIMSSKRKEALYRHIRALESARLNPSSSLNDSGILPPPSDSIYLSSPSNSGVLPPRSASPSTSPSPVPYPPHQSSQPPPRTQSRPRTDSASSSTSSSSERTARPLSMQSQRPRPLASTNGVENPAGPSRTSSSSYAQHRANRADPVTSAPKSRSVSTPIPNPYGDLSRRGQPSSAPRRPHQNHTRRVSALETVYAILPTAVQRQIDVASHNKWIRKLAYPLPVLILLTTLSIMRLRRRRAAAGAAAAVGAVEAAADLRNQLRLLRPGESAWEWLVWWFKWWMSKFAGVWRLGTTITYV